jgi:hypothetical protein
MMMEPEQMVSELAGVMVPCPCITSGEPVCIMCGPSPESKSVVHGPACDPCKGTDEMPKYNLRERCPGRPLVNPTHLDKREHPDIGCCDGSGERDVEPRLGAMVVLEVWWFEPWSHGHPWALISAAWRWSGTQGTASETILATACGTEGIAVIEPPEGVTDA